MAVYPFPMLIAEPEWRPASGILAAAKQQWVRVDVGRAEYVRFPRREGFDGLCRNQLDEATEGSQVSRRAGKGATTNRSPSSANQDPRGER